MKKETLHKYLKYCLLVIVGLFLGWLFFHSPHKSENKQASTELTNVAEVWTCSMHPHIHMDKPGKCPICGMDLIPLTQSNFTGDVDAVHLSKEAVELANVQTSIVTRQKQIKEIRLYGKVMADERLQQNQVAHIPGRIEKLNVNFTGESIRKGQTLATLYSPELITAQQEFLEAVKTKQTQPAIYEAAVEKLRQFKLTEKQINGIEENGNILRYIDIVSDITGIVITRRINSGEYVSAGTVMYDIADLSTVWVMFDAYENDLLFIKQGDKISFTVQALPGTKFSGNIVFIDPVIDPVTRVAKVRVEMSNQQGKLKPEMFSTGIVNANLAEYNDKLVIPSSAVLWTGKRSIVYVKQADSNEPIFKMREIELGPMLGKNYVVVNGLNEGEEIVTQGTFSIDAAAQLEGKPSMMNSKVSESNSNALINEEFKVSGNCDMCKKTIEKAAMSVNGVTAATWDKKTKIIKLLYNNTKANIQAIEQAIAKVGYDTPNFKAENETYKNLPECCWYRKKD